MLSRNRRDEEGGQDDGEIHTVKRRNLNTSQKQAIITIYSSK
jgi:hypothetical protein